MKYRQKSFTVPALKAEDWERIFGKRSSSLTDARSQDDRIRPVTEEQKCPNQS